MSDTEHKVTVLDEALTGSAGASNSAAVALTCCEGTICSDHFEKTSLSDRSDALVAALLARASDPTRIQAINTHLTGLIDGANAILNDLRALAASVEKSREEFDCTCKSLHEAIDVAHAKHVSC